MFVIVEVFMNMQIEVNLSIINLNGRMEKLKLGSLEHVI